MSDTGARDGDPPSAADVTARAAEWLQRREFWSWGANDQTALDAWLEELLAHRIAYTRLESAWSRTARLAALKSRLQKPVAAVRERAPSRFLRLAAIFTVAIGAAAVGVDRYWAPPETTYSTGIGQHKIITLADGSKIELNTSSTLQARLGSNRRSVKLVEGEAFFNIKHDPAHPFAVIADGHRITDLGTKFLVRAQPGRLEVSLIEGRAAFDVTGSGTQAPIVLTPGDALLVAHNQICTSRKTTRNLANELSWRQGMLIFENTSLGDVAAELNRYNKRKVIIADARAADIHISASFRTSGTEDLSQLAHVLFGLKVERGSMETVISR